MLSIRSLVKPYLWLGQNDLLNLKNILTCKDYSSTLDLIVRELIENVPEVLLMNSPPVDSTYFFLRHDCSLFGVETSEIIDSVSHIVRALVAKNNAFYLNQNKEFPDLNLLTHNNDLSFINEMNS